MQKDRLGGLSSVVSLFLSALCAVTAAARTAAFPATSDTVSYRSGEGGCYKHHKQDINDIHIKHLRKAYPEDVRQKLRPKLSHTAKRP